MTARPVSDLREIILRKSRESTATKEQFFVENADRIAACCQAMSRKRSSSCATEMSVSANHFKFSLPSASTSRRP